MCAQAVTRKVRILDVNYNASNNELVRTQTLVKNAIVQIDATPFKQWYQLHYGVELGAKATPEGVSPKVEDIKVGAYMHARVVGPCVPWQQCTVRMEAGCWSRMPSNGSGVGGKEGGTQSLRLSAAVERVLRQ